MEGCMSSMAWKKGHWTWEQLDLVGLYKNIYNQLFTAYLIVFSGENWLDIVRPVIEKRIQKYSEGEIHFNLMALVSDRQMIYQQKIDKLLQETENEMETDSKQNELTRYRMMIDDEISKKRRYKVRSYILILIAYNNICVLDREYST